MNLSDLLNVELYNDNLKMFNQAREETSVVLFENDLDEHVLENMHDRLVKQVYTDLVLKKEPRSYQRLRTMVNDILEQQQHTLGKDLKRKAKIDLSPFYLFTFYRFTVLHFSFLHFTFYILHFTFYILHSTFLHFLHVYILHFTFYILHFTFYILHFTFFLFYIFTFLHFYIFIFF